MVVFLGFRVGSEGISVFAWAFVKGVEVLFVWGVLAIEALIRYLGLLLWLVLLYPVFLLALKLLDHFRMFVLVNRSMRRRLLKFVLQSFDFVLKESNVVVDLWKRLLLQLHHLNLAWWCHWSIDGRWHLVRLQNSISVTLFVIIIINRLLTIL